MGRFRTTQPLLKACRSLQLLYASRSNRVQTTPSRSCLVSTRQYLKSPASSIRAHRMRPNPSTRTSRYFKHLAPVCRLVAATAGLVDFTGRRSDLSMHLRGHRNAAIPHCFAWLAYLATLTMSKCLCSAYADVVVNELFAAAPANRFTRLQARGSEFWWLSLRKCPDCRQHWLVAQEERLNDVFVLKRVSDIEAKGITQEGRWPEYLQRYEELLEIGKAHGHAAR